MMYVTLMHIIAYTFCIHNFIEKVCLKIEIPFELKRQTFFMFKATFGFICKYFGMSRPLLPLLKLQNTHNEYVVSIGLLV